MKTAQYRPSFSAEQVNHLLSILSSLEDVESKKIYQKLAVFKTKISTGEKSAAYVATKKLSVEESLGFSTPVKSSSKNLRRLYEESPELLTREETLEVLVQLHSENILSKEKIEEAKRLEILVYGMSMGLFD